MILASDTDVSEAFSVLSTLGLSLAFLVPTETAMNKSIIDATFPVRKHFRDAGFHDYAEQPQGPEFKVKKQSYFVGPDQLGETKTSMYRPRSKDGDPRIWFYKLQSYASANNLLAVIVANDALYLINCSNPDIIASLESGQNPLFTTINVSSSGLSSEAEELLGMLRSIGEAGWTKSLRSGDTGVGYTLETLLGIPANSKKAPDYKGVEVKSSRAKSSNQSLFAKTPDWGQSPVGSALKLLNLRGKFSEDKQRLQLFHSLFAPKPNSYGLRLEVDLENDVLIQYCDVAGRREDDVMWELETLRSALINKHRQTFWVKTRSRIAEGQEEFLYHQGVYTRGPNIDAFPLLIEAGDVFLDYTMWAPTIGKQDNKGFLFRMKKSRLETLFGKPKVFNLAAIP